MKKRRGWVCMKRRLMPLLMTLMVGLPMMAGADVLITEVMAQNGTYEKGHAYDWVELHNNGKETVNLSGWYFSDSGKNVEKWSFPNGTKLKAGDYLIVFCTGDDSLPSGSGDTFYAPFKISSSGEKLYLSNPEKELVEKLEVPPQYGTISWGLASDGVSYGYFEEATRGKKNPSAVQQGRAEQPSFLTPGGFYTGNVLVMVAAPEGATICYTTDGSTPTEKSKVFPADGLRLAKTTPVRLKAFANGLVSSQTVSATYWVDDAPLTPIVSLVTDDAYLFGKKNGALVRGTGSIPNYDKELEYPVNIEYYTAEGEGLINQMGTFTCSGHSARVNAQKSIALYARNEYGSNEFAFNPFPTRDYTGYHSLLLRGANSDTHATRLRDIVASSLAEGQGILYQDHQVIQVYINGEYWGHYNLREKINKYFVAAYEGVTDKEQIDAIDILARTGTDRFTQNGNNADWLELADFCKTHELNDPDNLAWVEQRLDIDSMFTHAAFEIILGNVDFTNVRVYRVPGGKWRYLLFDVEACWRNDDPTPIEYYIKPVNGKVQGFRHEPLNALLAVPEMKAKFLTRVADILTECFQWPHVEEQFDEVIEQLEPILPRHIARWNNMKLSNWQKNIRATKYYARVRPKLVPGMLKKAMKLTQAEMDTYFGDVLKLLEETNAKPD